MDSGSCYLITHISKCLSINCVFFNIIILVGDLVHVCSYILKFASAPLVEADKETNEENYLLWRLEKGVAEGSAEIPKGVL